MSNTGSPVGRARQVTRAAVAVGCVVAALTFVAASAHAQRTPRSPIASTDSARLVADLFFRALADERWDAAAALVDTTAIKRLVAAQVRQPPRRAPREMTVEDFMRDDPSKPRVVAEYELKRFRDMREQFDEGRVLSYEFAGVRTIEALRALSTSEATVAYLKAKDARVQFREAMRERIRSSGCADTTASLPYSIRRIIATALASDTVAYVLYEDGLFSLRSADGVSEDPNILVLRVRGSAWKIVPSMRMGGQMMGFSVVQCDSATGRPPR